MGTPIGDLLGAGTQTGDRNHHLDEHHGFVFPDFADQSNLVVEQALDAGYGRLLVHEIREPHLDMTGFGFQAPGHLAQHVFKGLDPDLALVSIQDFDETGHVRALEIMGQIDVHVEGGDGVLFALGAISHPYRMPDIFDAYLVDSDLARIRGVLDVGDAAVQDNALSC